MKMSDAVFHKEYAKRDDVKEIAYINTQKFRRIKFRRKNFGGNIFGHFLPISAE